MNTFHFLNPSGRRAVLTFTAIFIFLSLRGVDGSGPAGSDEILARPMPHLSEKAVQQLFAVHGAAQIDSIPQLNVRVLHVPAAKRDRVVDALSHNPNIEFAEKNSIASLGAMTDDLYVTCGYEWHLSQIKAFDAWNINTGDPATTIAICDTGVAPSQPDLAGKLLPGYNFYANNTDTADDYGHGTAVAGTAAAQGNNGIGVAGVAWAASILPIKISDPTGYATYSNMAKALTYAVDHGARVINISFYGSSSSSTLQSAADYVWNHNGIVFACAGNTGTSAPQYPAACRNVIAVSAVDYSDAVVTWSSYGSDISLSAPGVGIWTTNRDGTYGAWSGTSFASPITAAAAALLLAYDPQMTNTRLVQLLEGNSDDLGIAGYDIYYGYGRVNAYRALLAAGAPVVDTTAPVTSVTSPVADSTLSGPVTVQVSASDNIGVTKVELYIDNALSNTISQAPASFAWDTSTAANGTHVLRSLAYDAAGNSAASADINVNVQNNVAVTPDTLPPTAQITSPTDGAVVGRNQKIYTVTTDNVGVVRVELYLDQALNATSSNSSPMFNLNTSKWSKGVHTLQLLAYDAAGNAGSSGMVNITK
jgi:Subtilase family/Bacterial Ig domain/Fervidolysin N-terminal prodomain